LKSFFVFCIAVAHCFAGLSQPNLDILLIYHVKYDYSRHTLKNLVSKVFSRLQLEGENMMTRKSVFLIYTFCILIIFALSGNVSAQEEAAPSPELAREGYFEITLKTPTPTKLNVEELVRDRDLNPGALYRVRAGGYLAFDEADWVDKIEFKVADIPVVELEEYKKYSDILFTINDRIDRMKKTLGSYDQLALRLMNICDRSRFPTLQSMDENIAEQLAVYDKLVLLKEMVVMSMNKFIRERGCRDKFADYQKSLNLYARQLAELVKNVDRLNKRAATLSQELTKPPTEQPAPLSR
jgi:hypothetical protein